MKKTNCRTGESFGSPVAAAAAELPRPADNLGCLVLFFATFQRNPAASCLSRTIKDSSFVTHFARLKPFQKISGKQHFFFMFCKSTSFFLSLSLSPTHALTNPPSAFLSLFICLMVSSPEVHSHCNSTHIERGTHPV